MPTPKLTLVPLQAGFALGRPDDIASVALEGGPARYRRKRIGGAVPVSVQWTLDDDEFDYFQAFVETAIGDGALPFFCDMHLSGSTLQECFCHFVSISTSVDGLFLVTAQLEVIPGAQSTKPSIPRVLALPSPVTSDELPVVITCDWTTESLAVFVDGVEAGTIPALGTLGIYTLAGLADGAHAVTATATNAAGTSRISEPVGFYWGANAGAGTLDPAEVFDDT